MSFSNLKFDCTSHSGIHYASWPKHLWNV